MTDDKLRAALDDIDDALGSNPDRQEGWRRHQKARLALSLIEAALAKTPDPATGLDGLCRFEYESNGETLVCGMYAGHPTAGVQYGHYFVLPSLLPLAAEEPAEAVAALAPVPDEGPQDWQEWSLRARDRQIEVEDAARPAAAPALDRASWIEGWIQGAGQMTTWPPESLHHEAVRQYDKRAALSSKEPTDDR